MFIGWWRIRNISRPVKLKNYNCDENTSNNINRVAPKQKSENHNWSCLLKYKNKFFHLHLTSGKILPIDFFIKNRNMKEKKQFFWNRIKTSVLKIKKYKKTKYINISLLYMKIKREVMNIFLLKKTWNYLSS